LYRTEFEVPVPASVESSIVSDASEPLSYNWGAPYHIAQEINDNDVGNISGKISEKSTRKVFVFQPEELDRTRFRNIYERLDEAKKLAFTIPGLTITSFGIYPVNISEDFDEFLPIYDDKDWQIRLKNDVIWDETDIFFINVARLSPSHYLNLAWLLNEGYIPESEQVLTSLAFEKLKVQIWDRERMLLEVFRYRSIEDTLPTDIISEMHLKRLDSVDVRVTDEEADCRRVYSNHFKHKAEQRGQSERRVAHEMRKKLYHDVRRSNANLISKLEKFKLARTPIIAVIGPVNSGKSSVINYFTKESLKIDDFLFTTLSTKLYEGTVGDNFEAVFVDTLGFIPSLARFILS